MLAVAALAAVASAASGCAPSGVAVPDAAPPLALAAEARVVDSVLRADLRLTNTSRRTVRVGYGACSAQILGWRTPDQTGPPAFTSALARGADGVARGCPLYLATTELGPGQTLTPGDAHELRATVAVAEALSDSLPDGRYWLAATFGVAEVDGQPGTGATLRADLGPLDLAAERPPLAAEALRYGARFRVDSARVEGRRLRAVVRVVPVPRLGSDVLAFRPCAARVLAYADASRRNAAPRSGPPDAEATAACGQAAPVPFAPSPGPGVPDFYLAPEAAFRTEVDVALADLLGGQPAGRYALAVAVRTLGEPGYGLRLLPPVTLALGEADWRP